MRLAGASADTPKAYEADPLAYVAARLAAGRRADVSRRLLDLREPQRSVEIAVSNPRPVPAAGRRGWAVRRRPR
ncbi:hypothetical protein ABZT17_24695 [Streptomyces sp. NPDC005648]|uniref:hypothetical protein n=1 Tax=Streptomyces sp. NPDC005648 TaxID=3157044 RepID=UPI00339F895A